MDVDVVMTTMFTSQGQGLNDRTYYVTSRSEILCEKDYYVSANVC